MSTVEELRAVLPPLQKRIDDDAKSMERQRSVMTNLSVALSSDPPNHSVIKRQLQMPARKDLEARSTEIAEFIRSVDALNREAWKRLPLNVFPQFVKAAQDEGLKVDGHPPKLTVGRGIDVQFRLDENKTIVNGVRLESIDPRVVLA
jgi:hypothetical protein